VPPAAGGESRYGSTVEAERLSPAVARFHAEHDLPTPYLVIDLDVVADRFSALRAALGEASVYYAVKANPEPDVVRLLAALGANFDVASPAEIDLCLRVGVSPNRLSYGNTIKKRADIAHAYGVGVRLFAFDSAAELDKLATLAPGAAVMCRLLTHDTGADWPLSRKFGCAPDMAVDLLLEADERGLDACGVSFHVGSQQRDPGQWDAAVALAASVGRAVSRRSGDRVRLRVVDLGGGFPAHYLEDVPPIEQYADSIRASVDRHFPLPAAGGRPELMVEPGRFLVGDAGVMRTEVVLVARKSHADEERWVFLDAGVFGGLAETAGEAIKYRLVPSRGGPTGPVVLAGPTCDSADIMYQHHRYELPLALTDGDRLDVLSAGAYTSAYCTDGFNGFSPMPVHCLPPSAPLCSLALGDQEVGELPHVLLGRRGDPVPGEDVHPGP
jgi:ornithine decarboxylase